MHHNQGGALVRDGTNLYQTLVSSSLAFGSDSENLVQS